MSWDRLFRWTLFCAGIILVIFAGYMFNLKRLPEASMCLSLAVGFLCFATWVKPERPESSEPDNSNQELHDLAVLIADVAVSGLQNIGRTIPPGTKEIQELEEKLNHFLDAMPLTDEEREDIAERFETIRNRTRRNEGGRAILRNARL